MRKLLLPIFFGIALFLFPLFVNENAHCIHADKIFHFIGGVIVAWFFAGFSADAISASGKLKYIFILLAGVFTVGIVWEIFEYVAPHFRQTFFLFRFMQGGDWVDTAGDLAFDVLGGLVFSIPYVLFKKRDKTRR